MTAVEEREQLARIDLALADIAMRQEQLRQMKSFPSGTYEGWKVIFAGLTAFAAVFVSGAAVGGLIVHLLGRG